MMRFLLASPDAAFERRLRLAFGGGLNGDLQRLGDEDLAPAPMLRALRDGTAPEVVLVGPGVDDTAALDFARRFDAERPEISVVLVAERSSELLEQAMHAGVRDVLDPKATDAQIREVIERASQTAVRRRVNLVPDAEHGGQSGHILSVVSPKGGSGKTTVALNIAVGLAQHAPEQVVLVDLDVAFGDVASGLGLAPEHDLADAAANVATLDATALKMFLTPHPSGCYALCAPASPIEGEKISAEQTSEIVRLLGSEFRYVVLDTSAGISEHTLAALEASTDVVLLASMDVPSVRGLHKLVEALDQLGMGHLRRHVVLNRADSRVGLEAADIEATIGMPVNAALPSSKAVPLSINQGAPLLHTDPRSPVARAITGLVEQFVPQTANRGGLFSRLKVAR